MLKMVVKEFQDVIEINSKINYYDIIEINGNCINKSLLTRNLIKHSFWALNKDGFLVIKFEKDIGFGFKKNTLRFWQIRSEIFKVINIENYDLIENSLDQGLLKIQKRHLTNNNNKLTVGFVISNLEYEKKYLLNSLKNLKINSSIEIIICGPTKYKNDRFFNDNNIIYISKDINQHKGRILYTKKKNAIFQKASNNLVAICHSRILITKDFITKILCKHFEIATPSIYFLKDGKEYKYLDMLFIDDYHFMNKPKTKTILSTLENLNFHNNISERKIYIDGGVSVFNKNYIKANPYPEYLGWGEAEDVEMCSNLFNKGFLLERFFDIKCYSQTNKLILGESNFNKIRRKIKFWK